MVRLPGTAPPPRGILLALNIHVTGESGKQKPGGEERGGKKRDSRPKKLATLNGRLRSPTGRFPSKWMETGFASYRPLMPMRA